MFRALGCGNLHRAGPRGGVAGTIPMKKVVAQMAVRRVFEELDEYATSTVDVEVTWEVTERITEQAKDSSEIVQRQVPTDKGDQERAGVTQEWFIEEVVVDPVVVRVPGPKMEAILLACRGQIKGCHVAKWDGDDAPVP